MDLLRIILSNTKKIKNIEKHLCCLDPNGDGCPPISATVGNTIICNPDGIFAAGGGGTLTGAVNGLNVDGTNVELGGPLIQDDTTITGTTVTQKLTFTGLSEEASSNYEDGFVRINTTNNSPNATALGLSTLLNSSGIGLRISSDTGIQIDDAINYGVNINAIGSGIGAQINADTNHAISAFSSSGRGIWAFSSTNDGVRGQSTTGIGVYATNSITSQPALFVHRQTATGITLDNIATFRGTTNNIVALNSGLAIDVQPALPGAQVANALRVAVRWIGSLASPTSEIQLWGFTANAASQLMTIQGTGNGKIGIGTTVTAPTARLHLPAGAAGVQLAPLKFTTGTALTTPEDGAMEYHTSHLFFTIGSTRFQLDQQLTTASATNGLTFLSGSIRLGQAIGASSSSMISATREILTINQATGLRFQVAGNSSWRTDIRPNGLSIVGALANPGDSLISFSYDDNPFTLDIGYNPTWDGPHINASKVIAFNQGIQITPNGNGSALPGDPLTYPLKFVSTPLMTTPEDGAFEFDGTNLYFTTAGVRKTVTLV